LNKLADKIFQRAAFLDDHARAVPLLGKQHAVTRPHAGEQCSSRTRAQALQLLAEARRGHSARGWPQAKKALGRDSSRNHCRWTDDEDGLLVRLVLDDDHRAAVCGARALRWDLVAGALARWSPDGHTARQRYSQLEHWHGARPLPAPPTPLYVRTGRCLLLADNICAL